MSSLSERYRYLCNEPDSLIHNIGYCLRLILRHPKLCGILCGTKPNIDNVPINPGILCQEVALATGIIGDSVSDIWALHNEFVGDSDFHQAITTKLMTTSERHDKHPDFGYRELLYLMVRLAKPNRMIETGSYDGMSTAAILLAMHHNQRGKLWTIDLPNPNLPKDIRARPSWLVPDYLRDKLALREGTSSQWLRHVIQECVGNVDMFYHDSWHTESNMMFEYATVWDALRPGGWFISEYLPTVNKAYKRFIEDKPRPVILASNTHFVLRKL